MIEQVADRVAAMGRQIALLEAQEPGRNARYKTGALSRPPTATQLTTLFGSPATVGKGFHAFAFSSTDGNYWFVASTGANWLCVQMYVAVIT